MKKLIVLFIVFIFPAYAFAQRQVDKKPVVHTVTIEFNGETIKGFYCFIDARSNEEKSSNVQNKALHESVILFLQGHAQRADDAYKFTSQMALTSKSGVVVVVVCDTPYGKDSQYRGDAGKEIVVMAIAQHALTLHGINVIDAEQLSGLVTINGKTVSPSQGGIPATIPVVGWSHGALLARRVANRYSCVKNLVQICPAGFNDWPDNNCAANCCVLSAFSWESLRISTEMFKGHANDVFSASWGITKGIAGDSYRSCGSCLHGNVTVCKPLRAVKDITDVTIKANADNFPVATLSSIVVIFGSNDSLFNPQKLLNYRESLNPEDVERFWLKYYPEAVNNNARMNLFVLPGKHLAPVLYYKEYAFYTLKYTNELKE